MPRYKRRFAVAGTATALTALVVSAAAFGYVRRESAAPSRPHAPMAHHHHASGKGKLAQQVAAARFASAKYTFGLRRAKADGYKIITRMIPDMGWHFMNPSIQGFDVRRPQILVYERTPHGWQLGALEWVFTEKPAKPPLPGATYGSFAAACHYVDGTFTEAASEDQCAAKSPQTGAAFSFWHPKLVTLHLWAWYPNPDGIYEGMNPLVTPFN
ncbi:MAG TPA: hypothetical protein VGF25_18130 [Thermoleophilaceae bacterium]